MWVTVVVPAASGGEKLEIDQVSLATGAVSVLVRDSSLGEETLTSAGDYLYTGALDPGGSGLDLLRRYAKADGHWVNVAGATRGNVDGTGSDALFGSVNGVVSDGTSLWVADQDSGTLRQVSQAPAPPPTTVAAPRGGPVYTFETAGGSNPSENGDCQRCHGDPINTATGAYTENRADVAVPGRGVPLSWTRSYDSTRAGHLGRLGYGWTEGYDLRIQPDPSAGAGATLASATVVDVVQENGSQVAFSSDGHGSWVAPTRVLATLAHDPDGSWTFTRRHRLTLRFNSAGRLTAQTDLDGYTTGLGYNGGGQLITVTEPGGRTLTLSYGSNGNVATVTGPLNRQVSYGYDTAGNLISVTGAGGGVTRFSYDGGHLLLSKTDPNNGVTSNTYDLARRVLTQTDPMQRTTGFSYSNSGATGTNTVTITDPRGNRTVDAYTDSQLSSETKAAGTAGAATWSYTYDPVTLGVASVTDPNAHTSRSSYDSDGNLLTVTDPLGRTTTSTYDGLGDRLTVTDAKNVTTTNTYDSSGRLLTSSTPLTGTASTQTSSLTYGDPAHPEDVTSATNALGKTWTYTHDDQGNVTASTDPLGNTATASYDAVGQKTSSVSPQGNTAGGNPADYTSRYAYNGNGQVLTATDPLGHANSFGYDADGNLTHVTDPNQHTTRSTYNLDNEATAVTRADNTTISYTYDGAGNRTSQTNGAGKTSSYGYDTLNRLTSSADALNRSIHYGYDPAGNRTTATDAAGQTTTFGYDAAGQRTSLTYSDGLTPGVTFDYDPDGQRTTMTDGTGTTTYGYDSLHRLTASTDGAHATVGYGYDLAGRLTSIRYPGGTGTVGRGYDDAGRLISVTDWLQHTSRFGYDPDSNLTSQTYPTGTTTGYVYDRADRLTTLGYATSTGIPLATFAASTDPAGLTTAVTTTGTPQPSQGYSYDPLNRVTVAGDLQLRYDPAGNLTQLGGSTQGYDDAGQLTGSTSTSGVSTDYNYDQRGNRRTASTPTGTLGYGYDQENRLTSLSNSNSTVSDAYAYNGVGLRTSKTVPSGDNQFTYDLAQGIPLILGDGSASFVYGPAGQPLEQITADGSTLYLHHDAIGSTRLLTDAQGAVAATFAYDPYGNPTGRTGTATTPLGYAGQYTDQESGLQYLRARYYDPTTGNFLTHDPLAATTTQPYSYAGGNPISATDPTGTCSWNPFSDNTCLAAAAAAVPGGQGLDNALTSAVSFGDQVTFGISKQVRHAAGLGKSVNECSNAYNNEAVTAAATVFMFADGEGELAAAKDAETAAVDVGHAGIHQFPGITAGKSQFFDGVNLGRLSDTGDLAGVAQKNGNIRYLLRGQGEVGVDRTTGLPTDIYTIIRKPDGSVLTMFPGTSPMS